MNALHAGLCGAAGGLTIELLVFYRAIGRARGLPWKKDPDNEPGPPALLAALLSRMVIGGVLAWVFGASGQVSGVLGAFTTGVAADLLIDRLRVVRVDVSEADPVRQAQLNDGSATQVAAVEGNDA